jgi:hypothetical protein
MAQQFELSSRRRSLQAGEWRLVAFGRIAVALLIAAAGAVHLYLRFDYFHRVHVIGALFLAKARR